MPFSSLKVACPLCHVLPTFPTVGHLFAKGNVKYMLSRTHPIPEVLYVHTDKLGQPISTTSPLGRKNEPETALKELQFVAGECHLKFYSCLMLDTFSGHSCSIMQSWLICPLWVTLINLACFSLVELCMKCSGFLQTYLLFIRILRIVWTNTFQLTTRSAWWLAIHFPLSMVCDLSSKSNAITSVCQWVTETL